MSDSVSMAVIGAGRMGTALALSLGRLPAYRLTCVVSRSAHGAEDLARAAGAEVVAAEALPRAKVDLVWLTVPDRELERLAGDLAALGPWPHRPLFVHTSGCLSVAVLAALREQGQAVAGLHPLQAVASRGQLLRPGIYYALELAAA